MKEIVTKKGFVILVDDEDYGWLSQFTWGISKSAKRSNPYAVCQLFLKIVGKPMQMHRLILGLVEKDRSIVVDHINRNSLDNRKENLRIVTKQENEMNSDLRKNNKTGYKCVSLRKDTKKYRSYIAINGRQQSLGSYETAEEAARAYDKKVKELFPNHGFLNFGE